MSQEGQASSAALQVSRARHQPTPSSHRVQGEPNDTVVTCTYCLLRDFSLAKLPPACAVTTKPCISQDIFPPAALTPIQNLWRDPSSSPGASQGLRGHGCGGVLPPGEAALEEG